MERTELKEEKHLECSEGLKQENIIVRFVFRFILK